MTGFGRAERSADGWDCRVEIRSVNGRFLETRCRLPNGLAQCEERVKSVVKSRCSRGRFECSVTLSPSADGAAPLTLNVPLARAYGALLAEFREAAGRDVTVSLRDLIEVKDLVETESWAETGEAAESVLVETVSAALDGLVSMRESEGVRIAEELRDRTDSLESLLTQIEPLASEVPKQHEERLRENLARYAELESTQDERILQEIAILVDRSDISEEIARFKAHLRGLRDMLAGGGSLGRKFEFVLQELNREANTLAAKCGQVEISALVVEIKAELERLREQIQNIE